MSVLFNVNPLKNIQYINTSTSRLPFPADRDDRQNCTVGYIDGVVPRSPRSSDALAMTRSRGNFSFLTEHLVQRLVNLSKYGQIFDSDKFKFKFPKYSMILGDAFRASYTPTLRTVHRSAPSMVRQTEGTILERMFQAPRLQETSDVLEMICAFIADCQESHPDDLEWILAACLPILYEALNVWERHSVAFVPRSQCINVVRTRWGPEKWPEETFRHLFRFGKDNFNTLARALSLGPGVQIRTRARCSFSGEEALLVVLYRLSYPNRWISASLDMFHAQPSHLCELFLEAINYLDETFAQPLSNALRRIPQERLQYYADLVQKKTNTNNNRCIGFLDGTFRHHARPTSGQRDSYNGHYRGHGMKFVAALTPDGLMPFYFGPVEGRRHDSFVLSRSGLEACMDGIAEDGHGEWHVYADAAFSLTRHVQGGWSPHMNRTIDEALYTYMMNSGRISVEWGFGYVATLFKYVDYPKMLRVYSSPVAALYRVAIALSNMKVCMEGNATTAYFQCTPPSLDEYISWRE